MICSLPCRTLSLCAPVIARYVHIQCYKTARQYAMLYKEAPECRDKKLSETEAVHRTLYMLSEHTQQIISIDLENL